MKYRAQVMRGGSWDDALAHAAARRERAAGAPPGPLPRPLLGLLPGPAS